MVHVKYTYRDGKRYGPYYYENKRVGNKIITTYLGTEHPGARRRTGSSAWVFTVFGFLFLFAMAFILALGFQESISFSPAESLEVILSQSGFQAGESVSGNLNLILQSGELIPSNSKVVASFGGETREVLLSELVSDQVTVSGDFYLDGFGAFGSGEGYGLVGEKEGYPVVDFVLRLYEVPSSEDSAGIIEQPAEEVPQENPIEEVPVSPEETVEDGGLIGKKDVVSDSPENVADSAEGSSETSGPTSSSSDNQDSGAPSLSPSEDVVRGTVRSGEQFSVEIPSGWEVEVIEGSVESEGEELESNVLDVGISEGKVVVSTDYSVSEEGFGEDYVDGKETLQFKIDISRFEFVASEETSDLRFQIVYEDSVLLDASKEIIVGASVETEEPLPEEFVETPSEVGEEIVRVGEPVVWSKTVVGKAGEDFAELPSVAEVLSVVKEGVGDEEESIDESAVSESVDNVNVVEVSENVVKNTREVNSGEGVSDLVKVEAEGDLQLSPSEDVQLFAIDLAVGEIAMIVYQTPPVTVQSEFDEEKITLTYTAPDIPNHPYGPALASQIIPDEYLDKIDSMRIRWVNENKFVDYNLVDSDAGKLVEFEIPHFSNQTFEIIFITRAEHLNETRDFVEEVYELVKEKDGNWTTIPQNHYIRVTFERELDETKDITIYARSNGTARIEVYEKNGTEKIAEFTSVAEEMEQKIYLTNLEGTQDTFDLLVLNDSVEFDYVVDPVGSAPWIEFTGSTTSEGTMNSNFIYAGLNTTDDTYHYSFLELNNDLVLWMTMDERDSNGHPIDLSSYSNDGISEGAGPVTGQFGNASSIGSSSRILVPDLDNAAIIGDNSMTVSLRVKTSYANMDLVSDSGTTSSGGGGGKFGPSGLSSIWGWALYIDSDGKVAFQGAGNGGQITPLALTSSVSVTNNQWTHIALVENKETGRSLIYVNGFLRANGTTRSRATNSVRDFVIGPQEGDPFGWESMLIDDVVVFSRPLDEQEVRALYIVYSEPYPNQYYRNFTNLSLGTYSFKGYTVDEGGYKNETAERTVILSDDLSCGSLGTANTIYTLDSDLEINGTCFNIIGDNITLDGQGYSLTGNSSGFGVYALGVKNATIRNLNVNSFEIGVLLEHTNNSLIENITASFNNNSGVEVNDYSANNVVRNNVFRNNTGNSGIPNSGHGFSLYNNPKNNLVENNTIYGNVAWGIFIGTDPVGNILLNNNIFNNGGAEILDGTGDGKHNYLVYNNSFGEIKWTNTSFMDSLTVNGHLIFPGTIRVESNFVSVDESTFSSSPGMISSANITLRGNPASGLLAPAIYRNGTRPCNPSTLPACYNFTSLGASTVSFNVSAWSNYSLGESYVNVTGCRELNESKHYVLLNNIGPVSTTCFNITANYVTLDGNGSKIIGNSPAQWAVDSLYASGVLVGAVQGVKILNLSVVNFSDGIRLDGANNSLIERVSTSDNFGFGVFVKSGSGQVIRNVSTSMNKIGGFGVYNGDNNTLLELTSYLDSTGVQIYGLSRSNILRNSIINNTIIRALVVTGSGTDDNLIENVTFNVGSVRALEISDANRTKIKDSVVGNYSFVRAIVHFKNSQFGEINFSEPVNSTGENLSNDVKLSFNNAGVDSISKSGLNKSANVSLYNLPTNYQHPVVLRDGLPCSSQICNNLTSLNAGNVTFNVTHWTNYSISDIAFVTSCMDLNLSNTIYMLQNNIVPGRDPCFNITADNITFDGAGYTLARSSGQAWTGINVVNTENTTIKNFSSIRRFSYGLKLNGVKGFSIANNVLGLNDRGLNIDNSESGNISSNILFNNTVAGIYLNSPDYIIMKDNNLTGNSQSQYGIWIINGANNTIQSNFIDNNLEVVGGIGIWWDSTDDSKIISNFIRNNRKGISIQGDARRNLFLNNNIYGNLNGQIVDGSSANQFSSFVYNNSFGEIKWTNRSTSGFLDQININGNLTFPGTIKISSNFAEVDTSVFAGEGINSSANITLTGLNFTGSLRILRNGATCPVNICSPITNLTDGYAFNVTGWTNYSISNSSNTLPTVDLVFPDNHAPLEDRTPSFTWVVSDPDEQEWITSYLNITCHYVGGGTDCSGDNRVIQINDSLEVPDDNTYNFDYSLTTELKYLDDQYYYNWSVVAEDSFEKGPVSEVRRLNLDSVVYINLTNDVVNFDSVIPGNSYDTLGGNPPPFSLSNLGNVKVNVTMNATDLWNGSNINPTNLYQYWAPTWGALPSGFRPVPNSTTNETAIISLNHSQQSGSFALIHLNVTVPSNQPPGLRSSTITFTARNSE